MVVNVDELKGRIAKPKFVPRHKRTKPQKVITPKAAQVFTADLREDTDNQDLPQWRKDLEASLQPTFDAKMLSWTEKPIDQMTERDWRVMARDLELEMSETEIRPLRSWQDFDNASIRQTLTKIGYTEPSPVQRATIPLGIAGKDVVGIAETGSGKTAGFMLPLIVKVVSAKATAGRTNRVLGLVLAPTRELAQQIATEAQKFAAHGVRAVCVVGGHDIDDQARELPQADIVVATPGRLLDVMGQEIISLAKCETIVLDEADRMVDLGFEEQVTSILDTVPHNQTLMFSATWPEAIEAMATRYLRRPVRVKVGSSSTASRVNENIVQRAQLVDPSEKPNILRTIIAKKSPVIVFVNQKSTADTVTETLIQRGVRAAVMHGDLNQTQREAALVGLKTGKVAVLVATDVAGRGIDIPNVQLVVNYDMPRHFESYIHRIGRTGRAGQRGLAISLVTEADRASFADLKAALRQGRSPIPDFLNV